MLHQQFDAMTLDPKDIVKEGWITLFRNKKTGIFSSKQAPDRQLDRAWAVLQHFSSKGPIVSFYKDNRRDTKIMKGEKIQLLNVKEITRMMDHPKHPYCFTLKFKGSKRVLLNTDNEAELEKWLKILFELTKMEYKREKVIWEYYDGGLWNALPDNDSYCIESQYCENITSFDVGEPQQSLHYNLNNMTRSHPRTRATHSIKRTVYIEERPEVLHAKMKDLPAIWEWGDKSKDQWHPFEKETNKQIEEMYDSGSQWAELTLCLPSPMPFLLDLHDMKLVNFRTAVRYHLRRIDNSDNLQEGSAYPQARSPSPDDFEDQPQQLSMLSPMSPIFAPIQVHLSHLQVDRRHLSYIRMLGEGAFGEVFLATIESQHIPGCKPSDKQIEVAVKQLRLSDFIARHGHHSQQMEDFLREAKEMSKVDNHRVVKLMAVCTLDYPLLLIEEYINNGDLLGVLKDSRPNMPLTTQLTFAYHVAEGMEYLATELNTVHRDLAARNILVHKEPQGDMVAKIADFGLSRHLYSEMYKHQGTKPRPLPAKWMALESLMYFIFTTKSDVWSFGVLLWEIMTLGRSPYPGVENRELLEQIEEKGLKLSKPKPCPTVIFNMILDCTQHDPDERPAFKDLRDNLHSYLEMAKKGDLECDDSSVPTSPAPTTKTTISDNDRPKNECSAINNQQLNLDAKDPTVSEIEPQAVNIEVSEQQSDGKTADEVTKHADSEPNGASLMDSNKLVEPNCTTIPNVEKNVENTEPIHEVAGPHGHLYYLLDPLDDPHADKQSSLETPVSPNHIPPSNSPTHRSNTNALSKPPTSSPYRSKAYSHSSAPKEYR